MTENRCVDAAETTATYQRTSRRRWLRFLVVLTGVVFSGYLLWLWLTQCPISAIGAEDIVSARVIWIKRRDEPVTFLVNRQLALDMIAALTPNRFDWYPAKWVVLGTLEIELKGGTKCVVQLYDSDEELAAFSIGRRYYRGGTTSRLKALLQQGYAESATEAGRENGRENGTGLIK